MDANKISKFVIRHKSGREAAEELAKDLKSRLFEDCHEYSIGVPDHIGSGQIKMIDLFNGLSLTVYDFYTSDTLEVLLKNRAICMLRFSYCLEGSVIHNLSDNRVKLVVNSNSGLIHADRKDVELSLKFQPGNIRFLCIEIDRDKYLEKIKCDVEYLPSQLEEIFMDVDCSKRFLFHHNYLHSIHETSMDIFVNDFEGVVRRTYIEAAALEIVSQQIFDFINENEGKSNAVKQVEVEQLKKARDILRKQLKAGISIKELSKMVGLNQNKLKLGFKQVFGRTINSTLIRMRLEKAKLLIVANDLSIHEIAEEVGYQNKSFFTRKFKERYGMLPSEFRKEITASQ